MISHAYGKVDFLKTDVGNALYFKEYSYLWYDDVLQDILKYKDCVKDVDVYNNVVFNGLIGFIPFILRIDHRIDITPIIDILKQTKFKQIELNPKRKILKPKVIGNLNLN